MGKKIVASSKRGRSEDIYVIDIKDGTPQRITDDPHRDFHPVWSPDGGMIAFGRGVSFGDSEIYIMNADGSNPRKLVDNVPWNVHIAWSPDGKQIAFDSERDENHEIYVINTDGTNLKRLTYGPASDQYPLWSPAGTRIAFLSGEDRIRYLSVMNADGSNLMTVAHLDADGPPSFCSEPSLLVYWIIIAAAFISLSLVHFKLKDNIDKRITLGITAGALCGIVISVIVAGLLQAAPSSESEIFSIPFIWIFWIFCTVPGVLVVFFGREVINSTNDLFVPVAAAGIVLSLFFVFALVFLDISSGKFPYRYSVSKYILECLFFFALQTFLVLVLSLGSGSLSAQYILRRPIPKEKMSVHFPIRLYCPRCGNRIEMNWDRCLFCGKNLEEYWHRTKHESENK